jgi:hypothetical protein
MRSIVLGTVLATGMGVFGLSASASPITSEPVRTQLGLVESVQMSGYCRRLQRACEKKDVRGEAGEGNCRRYRTECLRGYRDGRRGDGMRQ